MSRTTSNNWPILFPVLLLIALLAPAGCSMGGGPDTMIKQWTLEYPAPLLDKIQTLPVRIKLARFTAAQAYNTAEMVYRKADFERGVYPYNRWRVNPADMIGDLLLRDLRARSRFEGVFSYRQRAKARFRLEGGVERFLEVDAGGNLKAELRLNLTLVDANQKNFLKRLLFQRDYSAATVMKKRNAAGLAQAMSKAMAEIAGRVVPDVYKAVQGVL